MVSPLNSSPFSLRPLLWLALPVLAEEALNLLVGYTDWWLAGHFLRGAETKAAMGLMAYVLWLLPSLFAAIAIGATALTARAVGNGDVASASRVANQALLIGGVAALVATAVTVLGARWFVTGMQLEQGAADLALRYIMILAPAIPFVMVEQVAAACLRGAGDTFSGFAAKSIVNVVNMIVSALLVLGPGPIPRLGWEGLAIGTALGHVMGGSLLLAILLAGRAGLRIELRLWRPDPQIRQRLLRIGVPGGIDVLSVIACHLVYVSIINSLGTLAAAAHGLGVQIEALAYLPATAFHVAAATIAGQALGAADPRGATRGVLTTCAVGSVFMICAALVFYFGGGLLTRVFTGDPDDATGQLAARLLKIVAFSTPALGVMMFLTGGLRGAGDTRLPLAITFLGLIGIRIPLACLLAWGAFTLPVLGITVSGLGWGVAGAWCAMTLDVIVRSLLVTLRFAQGGWKRIPL